MAKNDEAAEAAIKDGSQMKAFHTCIEALKSLPRESQVRVLASVAILFDVDIDVLNRIRRSL